MKPLSEQYESRKIPKVHNANNNKQEKREKQT